MRYSCKASVEYDLEMHYRLRAKYKEECVQRSMYEGCVIKKSREGKYCDYYSVRFSGQQQYRYVGKDLHTEIKTIRELAFYRKAISVIDANIKAMESFLQIYRITHAERINELIPCIYQLPLQSVKSLYDPEAEAWLAQCDQQKKQYPVFDPAGLKVTSFDGTMMRSRAEVVHHEAFYIYNVPAIFELPYTIEGETYRPDFTALDVFTMQQKMLEHLGNWYHSNEYKRQHYRQDSIHRWDEYGKIGYFPESNLLLTFGADDNTFDAQAIHRKIAMLSVPPPSEETMELLRRC